MLGLIVAFLMGFVAGIAITAYVLEQMGIDLTPIRAFGDTLWGRKKN